MINYIAAAFGIAFALGASLTYAKLERLDRGRDLPFPLFLVLGFAWPVTLWSLRGRDSNPRCPDNDSGDLVRWSTARPIM